MLNKNADFFDSVLHCFFCFVVVFFVFVFFAVAYNVKFRILTISLNFKEWDLYLENNLLFN